MEPVGGRRSTSLDCLIGVQNRHFVAASQHHVSRSRAVWLAGGIPRSQLKTSDSNGAIADLPAMGMLVAALAALPTLVHAAYEPSFLVDDWAFASTARYEGLRAFLTGSDVGSRPLQALYHGITFVVLGDRPAAHLVLLALVNGVAGYLLLRACRQRLSSRLALLIAFVWVALPNRGASRLWISTGPTITALALLLGAAYFALRRPPRLVPVVILVALSALSYEGGIVIGVALIGFAVWNGPPARRVTQGALAFAVIAAVAAGVYLNSPKLGVGSGGEGASQDALPALLGSGLVLDGLRDYSVLVIVVVLLATITAALPEFRRPDSARLLLVGGILIVLGILPFLAVRFPLTTDGMLDRANTFATVGVAVLLAGALEQLWRLRRTAPTLLASLVVLALGAANVDDIRDARLAGRDGETVLAAFERLDPAPDQPLVLAPMPNRGGYAAFGYGTISSAVRLRTGRTLDIKDTLTTAEFQSLPGTKYELIDGQLVDVTRAP